MADQIYFIDLLKHK